MPTPEPSPLSLADAALTARARRVPSPNGQRLLRRAERLTEQKRYDQAVASLEQALSAGADGFECSLRMAALYRAQQRWREALEAAERAVAFAPTRLDAHEAVMTIALEAGDCHRVIAACQALIKLAPRHLPAHNALGAAYVQLGEIDAAMRVTNTLIRLDPESSAHHFKKALLCQHKGEIALAVHEFSETVRLDPEGLHADAAREALETLDIYQLNQIVTLAMEDRVFRAKLERAPEEAAIERGFALSEAGNQILAEIVCQPFPEALEPCRPLRYN